MNTKPSTAHVTKEWVIENCKIVRKIKEVEDSVPLYDGMETPNYETLETVIREIVGELDETLGRFIIYKSLSFKNYVEDSLRVRIFTEYHWEETELRLGIKWKVKETYDQAVKRTIAAEKRKICQHVHLKD